MVGKIELERERGTLRISFPYRPDLVDKIRELPGRYWDKASKVWRVPAEHAEKAVATFLVYGFELAPEVSALLAEGATAPTAAKQPERPAVARKGRRGKAAALAPATPAGTGAEVAPGAIADEALTVSGLNQLVHDALAGRFPQAVWVVGEVQSYDKNKQQRHRFFELLEKDPDGQGQKARVTVVLFEQAATRLQRKLDKASEPMEVRDGIEVRVKVRVDLYVPRGQYQLVIEDLDTSFTLGKLELQRKQILQELDRRGLRDRNRELAFPELPLRIGLLTSDDSDALNDFVNELRAARLAFEVTHVPVAVQGEMLEPTMITGLRWFAARAAQFDVLCIVRGGGARTDLAWFDNLSVAIEVAQHPLKVVCGIGHQRDASVLDLIAHSEKTPTAAAALLVRLAQAAETRQESRFAEALRAAQLQLAQAREALRVHIRRFALAPRAALQGGRESLGHTLARIQMLAWHRLRAEQQELGAAQARIPTLLHSRHQLELQRLDAREAQLRALDPRQVVRRGFALLRDQAGKVLSSIAGIRTGAAVTAELSDGTVHAVVEKTLPA